jgi:hypothetical protein
MSLSRSDEQTEARARSAAAIPLANCSPLHRDRRPACCIAISQPPERPDLATYSQDEQFALGLEPSWDSPDILTNSWSPWRLLPETSVRVRNLSPKASAVGLLVALMTSPFGLGMERTAAAAQKLSLAPLQEERLLFAMTQATLAGEQRLGVHVAIEHPSDVHLLNNHGAQIACGEVTSAVGRSPRLSFPVRNPLAISQQISLSVLPNNLSAVVSPALHDFGPLEQIQATLDVVVSAALHGTAALDVIREATVTARGQDGSVIDGLTYLVGIDD